MKSIHKNNFKLNEAINLHREFCRHKNNLGELKIARTEVLCYCTGLTKSHFTHLMQKGSEAYNIDSLMLDTRAGYHCTGCSIDLKKYWSSELARFGLVSLKVKLERTRFSKDGKRISYSGHYPVYWIAKITELQKEWMERENFVEQFSFEIIDAPVPYVDFKLIGNCEHNKAEIYFTHFIHFVEFRTNAKWHFKLFF